jgi:hypothetical protein
MSLRKLHWPWFALVGLLISASAPMAQPGRGGRSPLVPPQSHAFGKSFDEWNFLYTIWALGGAQDDTVGRVRFLPGAFLVGEPDDIDEDGFAIFIDEFNIRLRPGTPFVLPPFLLVGETYDREDVPDDDPQDAFMIFATTDIRVTLNGAVLMEGTGADLAEFVYGPTYFEEPIFYDEPQPRGPDLNAIAGIFTVGIGAVYHPLPVGEHTLRVNWRAAFFGAELRATYHITVSPR